MTELNQQKQLDILFCRAVVRRSFDVEFWPNEFLADKIAINNSEIKSFLSVADTQTKLIFEMPHAFCYLFVDFGVLCQNKCFSFYFIFLFFNN